MNKILLTSEQSTVLNEIRLLQKLNHGSASRLNITKLIDFYNFTNNQYQVCEPLDYSNYKNFIVSASILHRQMITLTKQDMLFQPIEQYFGTKPVPIKALFFYEYILHYHTYNMQENKYFIRNQLRFLSLLNQITNTIYNWETFDETLYLHLIFSVSPIEKQQYLTNVVASNYKIYKQSGETFQKMMTNATFQILDILNDSVFYEQKMLNNV